MSTKCPCGKTHRREEFPDGGSPATKENPASVASNMRWSEQRQWWINTPQVRAEAGTGYRVVLTANTDLGHRNHQHFLYAMDPATRQESRGWRTPADDMPRIPADVRRVAIDWETMVRARGLTPHPRLERFGPYRLNPAADTTLRLGVDVPLVLRARNVPTAVTELSVYLAEEPRGEGSMVSVLVFSDAPGRDGFWVEFCNSPRDRRRFEATRWDGYPGGEPPAWLRLERDTPSERVRFV